MLLNPFNCTVDLLNKNTALIPITFNISLVSYTLQEALYNPYHQQQTKVVCQRGTRP